MSSFLDALKNPLPSYVKESGENPFSEEIKTVEENIDDDELNELEDDAEREFMNVPEDTEMTPDEAEEADKLINITATPIVLKEVLGFESTREFLESAEFGIACDEGFFMEGERTPLIRSTGNYFLESGETFLESKFYQKNMIRLTKQSKLRQLFEICIQAVARAKNDAVYNKLTRIQALRRKYKAILRERYKSQAMKKAKEYLLRLKQSKSSTLRNVASDINKK